MKRLSLEHKITDLLKEDLSVISLSFYGGKYTAIYTDKGYTYTSKSKSISRVITQLGKFIKECE